MQLLVPFAADLIEIEIVADGFDFRSRKPMAADLVWNFSHVLYILHFRVCIRYSLVLYCQDLKKKKRRNHKKLRLSQKKILGDYIP